MVNSPRITCSRCGKLKLPGLPCINCKLTGRDYNGHQPILESTVNLLKAARAKDSRNMRSAAFKRTTRGKITYAKKSRRRYAITRLDTMRLLYQQLFALVSCFEQGLDGEYEIYADRLEEAQDVIAKAHVLLPLAMKLIDCAPPVR